MHVLKGEQKVVTLTVAKQDKLPQ